MSGDARDPSELSESKQELYEEVLGGEASLSEDRIPRRETDPAPLSFEQRGLWLVDQLGERASEYTVAGDVPLDGPVDAERLDRALTRIVERHEVLRTTYERRDGDPVQVVHEAPDSCLRTRDLTDLSDDERDRRVLELVQGNAQASFDLAEGPVCRFQLLRLDEDEHLLLYAFHHVAFDAWSTPVFLRELEETYTALGEGRSPELPDLEIQYADYAAWQRDSFREGQIQEELDYWRDKLAGLEPLELPTDHPRSSVEPGEGATVSVQVPDDLAGRLQKLADREGASLFMTLLAAFKLLLRRHTRQADVPVGSPVAGRDRTETENLIGFFVNMLVLRTDLDGAESFRDVLDRVRTTCVEAFDHQDIPYDRLVSELDLQREVGADALTRAVFAHQNVPELEQELADAAEGGAGQDMQAAAANAGKFDIQLTMMGSESGLEGVLQYDSALFDRDSMERFADRFRTLLASIADRPEAPLDELDLLPDAERERLLETFNETDRGYELDHTLHGLVERQARRTPEAVAVEGLETRLTFQQLDRRANRLAHHLRDARGGLEPDTPVAVHLERGPDLVVALLATLKAGGCYVPIAPDYPAERKTYILEDTEAPLVLTQADHPAELPDVAHDPTLVPLDDPTPPLDERPAEAPDADAGPDQLAYILYTSGTTGAPKGVMLNHRGPVNRITWMQEAFPIDGDDAVLQKTPFTFDVSVWEFFWPLVTGARMVLAEPNGHRDPAHLVERIREHDVTVMHFVPSMMPPFLATDGAGECTSLETVVSSGEALTPELRDRLHATLPNADLHNLYGPTEASIDVTHWPCRREDPPEEIPIGRPIANTRAYVLDEDDNLAPLGVPGELYISGVQLARGYRNKPERTREAFGSNPFHDEHAPAGSPGDDEASWAAIEEGHERLYATGDLARWSRDGVIAFLGRIDHQVQVRGHRVEPGEIEATLTGHPELLDVAVVPFGDDGGATQLAGYLVPEADEVPPVEELRAYVGERLPDYMIPARFVEIDEIPLTANGKLDRDALPEPEGRPDLGQAYVEPETDAERAVADAWAEVLDVDQVGRHDGFLELGGDSLKAVRVVSEIQAELGAEISLEEFFESPTVAEIASLAEQAEGEDAGDEGPSGIEWEEYRVD